MRGAERPSEATNFMLLVCIVEILCMTVRSLNIEAWGLQFFSYYAIAQNAAGYISCHVCRSFAA